MSMPPVDPGMFMGLPGNGEVGLPVAGIPVGMLVALDRGAMSVQVRMVAVMPGIVEVKAASVSPGPHADANQGEADRPLGPALGGRWNRQAAPGKHRTGDEDGQRVT